AGVDEVHLGRERRVEPVLPALQAGQQWEVLGLQGVEAGAEDVGEPALVDEDRDLALPDRQPGAHLDLVLVPRKAPDHGVPAVVGPFDDVDELALDPVDQAHWSPPSAWSASLD